MELYELNKELCDCVNEQSKLEWALSIESNMYKRLIELQKRIDELRNDITSFYHPVA
jgi:hypothetical protein